MATAAKVLHGSISHAVVYLPMLDMQCSSIKVIFQQK